MSLTVKLYAILVQRSTLLVRLTTTKQHGTLTGRQAA